MRKNIIESINTNRVDIPFLYERYVKLKGRIDPNLFRQSIVMYGQQVGILGIYKWTLEEYKINILTKKDGSFFAY